MIAHQPGDREVSTSWSARAWAERMARDDPRNGQPVPAQYPGRILTLAEILASVHQARPAQPYSPHVADRLAATIRSSPALTDTIAAIALAVIQEHRHDRA